MIWPSIGVLFAIDKLGATDDERMFYGTQARRIFMQHFKPRAIGGGAYLWQGDAQTRGSDGERRFCIAVSLEDGTKLATVQGFFADAGDRGLAPFTQRFCMHPVDVDFSTGAPKPIRREPLPLWLGIDSHGTIVLPVADAEDESLCDEFGWSFRVGK